MPMLVAKVRVEFMLSIRGPNANLAMDEAAIVNTNSLVTANPVIGLDSPAGVFAAGQEAIEEPSEENFSMRPVLKYATNTEVIRFRGNPRGPLVRR